MLSILRLNFCPANGRYGIFFAEAVSLNEFISEYCTCKSRKHLHAFRLVNVYGFWYTSCQRSYSLYCFLRPFTVAEGCQAEVAFTAGTEADTGGADDLHLLQQMIEEIPGGHAAGCFEPDVGRMHASVDGQPRFLQALPDLGKQP